jgi:hypothetical protein
MEVAKGRELTDKKMGKNQQGRQDGANSTVEMTAEMPTGKTGRRRRGDCVL